MAIKFANNATTTLASGIISSDTTITVAGSSGGLFPAAGSGDYFYATLVNSANDIEIVKVTARSGDVMTVVRGQDGTVALDWIGGDRFELRITARALVDISLGTNITDLDGVQIGQSEPENATFLDVEVESLTISGLAIGTTPGLGDSSTKLATTAFVHQNSSMPAGCIVLWSGSVVSIPSGWYLCNGSNGTPDLRNRFVVGAGSTYAVGATGGSADAITVSHTHTFNATTSGVGDHTHSLFGSSSGTTGTGAFENRVPSGSRTSGAAGAHDHTVSGTTDSQGASGTNANLPPYYALAYIMKG